ncbi:MAG: hypothetical protein HZB30_00475 [Nitrospirae bacterium]|nr:hypothetical protein [Nitrospirota bacterium]
MFRLSIILFVFVTIFTLLACSESKNKKEDVVFSQIPEIQEVKPDNPAKIKLKRNAKDDYSWEISGDDVEDVVRVDKRLRKDLNAQ